MKATKARAFALIRRPVGKTAHNAIGGKVQSRKHPADQSALEFRGEHPLRRDGEAKTSEHCR